MATQELIKWIKNGLNQGYSLNQIQEKLVEAGYKHEDIQQACNQALGEREKKANTSLTSQIILIILVVSFVAGAMIFFSKGNDHLLQDEIITQKINECINFAENMKSCTKYSCEFYHVISGELLTREIKQFENNNCIYVEKMPNNFEMQCAYSENSMNLISNYYDEMKASNKFVTQIVITGDSFNYVVNGIDTENPINKAIINGECKLVKV